MARNERSGMSTFLVRALSPVAMSATVAIHAQHLVPRRIAAGLKKLVELVASAGAGCFAVLVAVAIKVIQGQEKRFSFSATRARNATIGFKSGCSESVKPPRVSSPMPCDVSGVVLAEAGRVFEPRGFSFCSKKLSLCEDGFFVFRVVLGCFRPLFSAVADRTDVTAPEVCGRERKSLKGFFLFAGLAHPKTCVW